MIRCWIKERTTSNKNQYALFTLERMFERSVWSYRSITGIRTAFYDFEEDRIKAMRESNLPVIDKTYLGIESNVYDFNEEEYKAALAELANDLCDH